MLVGIVLFVLGNTVAATATGFPGLIVGRVLTGVRAVAASPAALALLVTSFPSAPGQA